SSSSTASLSVSCCVSSVGAASASASPLSEVSSLSIFSVWLTMIKSESKSFQDFKLSTETSQSWLIWLKVSPSSTWYSSAETPVADAPKTTNPAAHDISTFFIINVPPCDELRYLSQQCLH